MQSSSCSSSTVEVATYVMLLEMSSRLATVAVVALALACARNESLPVKDVDAVAALAGRATLAGPTIDVAALKDKIVVINFWSPG